jgi:hypothetical protein
MKYINYKGVQFKYEFDEIAEITYFYNGSYLDHKYKIFGLKFGEIVKKPKLAFSVHINIEDTKYNKKYIQGIVEQAFNVWKRKNEIENGEII